MSAGWIIEAIEREAVYQVLTKARAEAKPHLYDEEGQLEIEVVLEEEVDDYNAITFSQEQMLATLLDRLSEMNHADAQEECAKLAAALRSLAAEVERMAEPR